ncbi:MAG: hypothetical protein ACRBFS_08985 [Aureispira sp.]
MDICLVKQDSARLIYVHGEDCVTIGCVTIGCVTRNATNTEAYAVLEGIEQNVPYWRW